MNEAEMKKRAEDYDRLALDLEDLAARPPEHGGFVDHQVKSVIGTFANEARASARRWREGKATCAP